MASLTLSNTSILSIYRNQTVLSNSGNHTHTITVSNTSPLIFGTVRSSDYAGFDMDTHLQYKNIRFKNYIMYDLYVEIDKREINVTTCDQPTFDKFLRIFKKIHNDYDLTKLTRVGEKDNSIDTFDRCIHRYSDDKIIGDILPIIDKNRLIVIEATVESYHQDLQRIQTVISMLKNSFVQTKGLMHLRRK